MNTDSLTSPAKPHAPQSNLPDLNQLGDHYAVIHTAESRIGQGHGDIGLAVLAARSYVALGLVGPARDLLAAFGDPSSPNSEASEIMKCIQKAPSGRFGWGRSQARFETNARRLYERHPVLQEYDETFRSLPRKLELYRSIDGNIHVSKRSTEPIGRWHPDLRDTKSLAGGAKLGHAPGAGFCGPYLLVADRMGTLLDRVYRATAKMFLNFTPRIYVVEPDVELFGTAMYLADSIEQWCDERIELFIGPSAYDHLIEHFKTHPKRTMPAYVLTGQLTPNPACDQALDRLQEMGEARTRKGKETLATVTAEYNALPTSHWRQRFTEGKPLRVLGITSRFTTYLQYSMRDSKAAFERHGHEFKLLIEPDDHEVLPAEANVEVLARFKPDLVFIIDHLRAEYPDTIPANVPFVCWIQDQLPHLTQKVAGRSMSPLDFYIVPELQQFVHCYDYPADQGMAWTMATDDTFFSAEPMSEDILGSHRCDFSFVSNQSKQPRVFHEELARSLGRSDQGDRLMEYLFEAITRDNVEEPRTAGVHPAMALLEQAKRDIGVAASSPEIEDTVARRYIHPLRELIYRQTALEWVADYCDRTGRVLHLYGNGWDQHPRFAQYARGFAENGDQLRAIYQASRINLQITSYGAVHQRLLDGLAAGGFFLIRYCPTDVIHEPTKQFLSLVQTHHIEPDIDYQVENFPEVAGAWRTIRRLHGDPCQGSSFRIPEAELTRMRGLADGNYRLVGGATFDQYDKVSYANAKEFEQLADRFLSDDTGRRETVSSMRSVVVDRFTYTALVTDLLGFIRNHLGHRHS